MTALCPSSYVTAALDEESRPAALQESRPAVACRRLGQAVARGRRKGRTSTDGTGA